MNLKKPFSILLCCFVALSISGCRTSSDTDSSAREDETEYSFEVASYEPMYVPETESVFEEITQKAADGVDVDLTVLSPTMIFAEVYNMMATPDDYVGKVVKISGKYYSVTDKEDGKTYFYVLIKDATACCEQGMEFIWDEGTHAYPEEYPAEESEVTITGIFNYYVEDGLTFCYLDIDGFEQ